MIRLSDGPPKVADNTAKERCQSQPVEYCLMTAAYNEECTIGQIIESVLSQTLLPKRWVIVSDGCVDKTDEIVKAYAAKHDFIRFLKITRTPGRSFRSKAVALRYGGKLLEDITSEFIGN